MTDDNMSHAPHPGQTPTAGAWNPPLNAPTEDTRKTYSWGRNLPALRLNRPPEIERTRRPISAPTVYRLKPPWYLRPVRMLLGLALLAGSWGLSLLLLAWSQSIWANLPQMLQLDTTLLIFALEVLGALGLAVATLALFVVGVFSLLTGLTARGW
jgi:hypothetical protein